MQIFVTGVATTKFGELWGTSPRTLAREAVTGALVDAHMDAAEVEALFVGNMLSGMLGGQEHLGAFFAEELALAVPAFKIEGACASGGLAMHNAIAAVASGRYQTVAVLGIEKMTDHKPDDVATALMGAGSEEERTAGATFPGLYAILARTHMDTYNTSPVDLAAVAVKNHEHASQNPNAQFRAHITEAQVLASTMIADPLHLLDCSPISDGAAAVIVTSRPTNPKKSVEVAASAVATDSLGLSQRKSLVELAASRSAAAAAYNEAGITPADIQVVELHDCFTIAEIFALEDLGFFAKGKAARAIRAGKLTLGASKGLVANPSGGLKGCGHPVGATGVKQIVELVVQLRGEAGARQVAGARVGLAHNVGGSGGTAVVHILKQS